MALPTPGAATADIGLIGLAVMGQNLALNIADHGHRIAVFNRTEAVTEKFAADAQHANVIPAGTLEGFVRAIKRPRRIILLIKAGTATDAVIDQVAPLLEAGDCIIDGGNALFTDTIRREKALTAKGLLFVGSGVSGGEEGARLGPSLMPGGKPEAWKLIEPIWKDIAAKVDPQTGKPLPGGAPGKPVQGGVPCTTYIGSDGAGHYVKMVHNGIEYADMELIAEAYDVLTRVLGLSVQQAAETFAQWNQGDLDSFLIEITAEVLRQKDPVTGKPFVEVVLDAAGQKGTGKWTSASSLELGVPAATIAEAVFQRTLSARKEERVAASKILKGQKQSHGLALTTDQVRDALYCSKIAAYAQGFQLMAAAAAEYKWSLDFGAIAQIFRGGCIIRARFLQKITEAYARDASLKNLMLDPYFAGAIEKAEAGWRKTVAACALEGIPAPAFSSALSYFDGYRSAQLPANLLQAQRDFFGAHTYERVDAPRGKFFHIDWPDAKRPQLEA